jgi:hypothetical protein
MTPSGVTEGTRTPDTRDHNPVLYQLSYSHHERLADGRPPRCRPMIAPTYSCWAMALAASTSGPGSGTNTVRR